MRARRVGLWLGVLGLVACGDASGPAAPTGLDDQPQAVDDRQVSDESPLPPCEVPSEPEALLAYLRRGDYKQLAHRESAVHGSSGPHGGRVLTYVNDLLAESLDLGNEQHPRCSASVKELYLGKPEVSGWAVLVKTSDDSKQGRGYYWLETLSTREGREADYEGDGEGICVGCHKAGRDYFTTPWPLQ